MPPICQPAVRTIPRSRHDPQFHADALPASLAEAKIRHRHVPGLVGLRHTTQASINVGWQNASFRGFVDSMQTPAFADSLPELIRLAERRRLAVMCAEAVPWRCHRSLIADVLLARGIQVEHPLSPTRKQAHTLTPFAKVRGTQVTYPAPETVAG